MRIVFSGLIGQSGTGGQAWATMQYLAGLRDLGHTVVYLEDCGDWISVYHWDEAAQTSRIDYPASYVNESLATIGMQNDWIFRGGAESRGMDAQRFAEFCSSADLLVMRGAPLSVWRSEYSHPRRRAFIDVDPAFTQMRLANGDDEFRDRLLRSERHFTVGANVGKPGTPIPSGGFDWIPTRPPVHLPSWPSCAANAASPITSIMRWRGFTDVQYEGELYGQKDMSFPAYLALPGSSGAPFRIASVGEAPPGLERAGWEVVAGYDATRTPDLYRRFIQESAAEFCVPKHAYVATHSGWFSDRSVCYLASGKPVLMGDTGVQGEVPTGEGVLTFSTPDAAVHAVADLLSDYASHCRSARQIAEEYFATGKVLPRFLDLAMS